MQAELLIIGVLILILFALSWRAGLVGLGTALYIIYGLGKSRFHARHSLENLGLVLMVIGAILLLLEAREKPRR